MLAITTSAHTTALLDAYIPTVMEAVSGVSEEEVVDALRYCNYDVNKTINHLLDKQNGEILYFV